MVIYIVMRTFREKSWLAKYRIGPKVIDLLILLPGDMQQTDIAT